MTGGVVRKRYRWIYLTTGGRDVVEASRIAVRPVHPRTTSSVWTQVQVRFPPRPRPTIPPHRGTVVTTRPSRFRTPVVHPVPDGDTGESLPNLPPSGTSEKAPFGRPGTTSNVSTRPVPSPPSHRSPGSQWGEMSIRRFRFVTLKETRRRNNSVLSVSYVKWTEFTCQVSQHAGGGISQNVLK